jgi:hypothetical protein
MKKLAICGLLATVLVFSLGLFVNDAHARTALAPVIKINDQSDEVDKLEDEVDQYRDQVNKLGSSVANKDSLISSLKGQITALTQSINRTTPYISILSPKIGKVINSKEKLDIKWKGVNLSGATIDIYLAVKDSPAILVANVPNNGSASLNLPSSLPNGSYYLTLTAKDLVVGGKAVSRQVKTPFKIADKSTQSISIRGVVTPDKTANKVARGGEVSITFATTNIPAGTALTVSIASSTENSLTDSTLVKEFKSTAASQTIKAVVPNSTTLGDHKIIVSIKGSTSVVAYSSNNITVTGSNTPDVTSSTTVSIISPYGGDDYYVSAGNNLSVKIAGTFINSDKERTAVVEVQNTTTNTNTLLANKKIKELLSGTNIKIPTSIANGVYKVRVTFTTASESFVKESTRFPIISLGANAGTPSPLIYTLTVTSPVTSSVKAGSSVRVKADSTNVPNNAKIKAYLVSSGTSEVQIIKERSFRSCPPYPADCTSLKVGLGATIPKTTLPGSYKVRV